MICKVKVFESDWEWLNYIANDLGLSDYDVVEIIIEYWKKNKGETALAFYDDYTKAGEK